MKQHRHPALSRRKFVTGALAGSALYGLGRSWGYASQVPGSPSRVPVLTGKDFGAMRGAEAHQKHPESEQQETPSGKIWKGVVPVLTMLGMTLIGLYVTGTRALGEGTHGLTAIIGAADSFKALLCL